jgi:hypothetical protein
MEVSMQNQTGLSTWMWVVKSWIALYLVLFTSAIVLSLNTLSAYYWILFLLVVPVFVIPMTYRNLVGGGCSMRFQICALVKGVMAGFLFLLFTGLADFIIWSVLGSSLSWTPLSEPRVLMNLYQVLLISGMIGGIGARIVEVRGGPRVRVPELRPIIGDNA